MVKFPSCNSIVSRRGATRAAPDAPGFEDSAVPARGISIRLVTGRGSVSPRFLSWARAIIVAMITPPTTMAIIDRQPIPAIRPAVRHPLRFFSIRSAELYITGFALLEDPKLQRP